jgi:hypothetical protein
MSAVETRVMRLVHDGARDLRLFDNGSDSALEDVAFGSATAPAYDYPSPVLGGVAS